VLRLLGEVIIKKHKMGTWKTTAIIAIVALLIGSVLGYTLRSKTYHCPAITHDITYVKDTVDHIIYDHVPWYYLVLRDSIIYNVVDVPNNIDTAAVVKAYYSRYTYDRLWQDSLIQVKMTDIITQNKPLHNEFKYKILRPQTVYTTNVDNSIYYNRALYAGITINTFDNKTWQLSAAYADKNAMINVAYCIKQNAFTIGFHTAIAHF
jgi:hypothetical protein